MGKASSGYVNKFGWNLGFSAYWFATSYKWFILLFVFLPKQVADIVPGGEKNTYWGLILGTGAIWAVIGPAVFGRLHETKGGIWAKRHIWLAIGSAGTLIALMVLVGASSLWILALGYFLLQLSDDVGTGPYAGMVAEVVPEEHRGFSSAILGGFKLFGQIASAIMALVLKKIELVYIGIATVNLICAIITILTIKNLPDKEIDPDAKSETFVKEYLAPFKNSDFVKVWLNRMIVAFAFASITAYTRNFLEDTYAATKSIEFFLMNFKNPESYANDAANILALTISFTGILGSLFSARYADRIGRKKLLVISAMIMAIALVPIAMTKDFNLIWMMVAGFGLGNGLYAAADWALASDVLPDQSRPATQMGAWQSSETAVQIPAGIVMGALIDTLNRQSAGLGYQAMLITAATLFFCSTFLVKRIRGSH
ncbi:MAG: MFS transporter [Armatimonadetes bacterium]|nr:MFS transporter [Armatimonadota bacterium]